MRDQHITITKGGRDWALLAFPLYPKSDPRGASASAVPATGDDLIAGLGFIRDRNDGGHVRTLEEERDAAVAGAVALEAKLALALDLLGSEMSEAVARDMPRSPRDVALRSLAADGTSHMLREWRTARELAREAMQVIGNARIGVYPRTADVDALLGRMVTGLNALVVVEE
jgi:hypothetical protein